MTFETLKKIEELLKTDVEKQKLYVDKANEHVETLKKNLNVAVYGYGTVEAERDDEEIKKIESEIEDWKKLRKRELDELQKSEYALNDFLQHDWH